MNMEYLWLVILSLSFSWLYFRILKLYEKVRHIYFLIGVSDHRLDKLDHRLDELEGKEFDPFNTLVEDEQ